MNREIKFRVKNSNDEWLYFEVIDSKTGLWGFPADESVKINTLCQFTGLKDKNNKEIYERDIVESHRDSSRKYEIIYDSKYAEFIGKGINTGFTYGAKDWHLSEVIGNIYQKQRTIK